MGCPRWMQHFYCVTDALWITWVSTWTAALTKATARSSVTLTCISSSTEHPEMTLVLQSLTYFKARLILSKLQMHLRVKRQKQKLLKSESSFLVTGSCPQQVSELLDVGIRSSLRSLAFLTRPSQAHAVVLAFRAKKRGKQSLLVTASFAQLSNGRSN